MSFRLTLSISALIEMALDQLVALKIIICIDNARLLLHVQVIYLFLVLLIPFAVTSTYIVCSMSFFLLSGSLPV